MEMLNWKSTKKSNNNLVHGTIGNEMLYKLTVKLLYRVLWEKMPSKKYIKRVVKQYQEWEF